MTNRLVSIACALLCLAGTTASAAEADNRIFIFSPGESAGLRVAVADGGQWHELGQLCSSDYGPWGAEKKMHHPCVCRSDDGTWRLVFQVNDRAPLFAAAFSRDLATWRPQDYPVVSTRQCLEPVVRQNDGKMEVFYRSEQGVRRVVASPDFRHFSVDAPASADEQLWSRDTVTVGDRRCVGQLFDVSRADIDLLRSHFEAQAADARLSQERMHDDAGRFGWLQPTVAATLTIDASDEKAISDMLIGIFFEDISYAADGGLYAEMVQNRDFEYTPRDRHGWTATTAWHSPAEITIATDRPLSQQNPHYAVVRADSLVNEGWDGMAIEKGQRYDFSVFVRGDKHIDIELVDHDGQTVARAAIDARGDEWRQYTAVMKARRTTSRARLALVPRGDGEACVDMVSLFPRNTFKNRKNGLRRDLAETIAALRPSFVRFPGGCMSHGQGIGNIYHWDQTIGPLWERTPDMNIWHYHQTRGLGFYEYFLFCEDIGAEPLPVLAAGVPCQNSGADSRGVAGQQGGIDMSDMPAYIDELCNLIDWANAAPATNEWARKRAEAGHPEPFNLKYIGIGNEDLISTVFEERYAMICQAINERHPEIKVCGTVGPFHAPSADYIEGWDFTRRHPRLQYMTDEHYYESTGWFMHHRDYYDHYDRNATKVYLGEWAASTKARRPNVETALAEALYLTDIERNGDVVEMTSYAPMLCKDGHSNWNPDMIYFSNTSVRITPAYEVQRLFSTYGGDRYVASRLDIDPRLRHRVGASLVRDSKTGRRCLKLVNALPSTLHIDIEGLQLPGSVKVEQLTGGVEDQKARAETFKTSEPTTLPPYSLRVIELK